MKNIFLTFVLPVVFALLAGPTFNASAQHLEKRAGIKNPAWGFRALLEMNARENSPAGLAAPSAALSLDGETEIQPSAQEGIQVHGFLAGRVKRLLPAVRSQESEPSTLGTVPRVFALDQNYPNPFNPTTTVRYALPERSHVRIQIYNILGQVVTNLVEAEQDAGFKQVVWNARVSSGLYFYRFEAVSANDPNRRFVDVRKMILLR